MWVVGCGGWYQSRDIFSHYSLPPRRRVLHTKHAAPQQQVLDHAPNAHTLCAHTRRGQSDAFSRESPVYIILARRMCAHWRVCARASLSVPSAARYARTILSTFVCCRCARLCVLYVSRSPVRCACTRPARVHGQVAAMRGMSGMYAVAGVERARNASKLCVYTSRDV